MDESVVILYIFTAVPACGVVCEGSGFTIRTLKIKFKVDFWCSYL